MLLQICFQLLFLILRFHPLSFSDPDSTTKSEVCGENNEIFQIFLCVLELQRPQQLTEYEQFDATIIE